MIVLAYIGCHKGDGFRVWAGWAIIRSAQIGRKFRKVTHTELLTGGDRTAADIGSATMLDGGVVRIKRGVVLNPAHWLVFELPDTNARNSGTARKWFNAHAGERYDRRGSVGSVLYGIGQADGEWFCNEACGAALGQTDPHMMPPAGFVAWLVDLGAVDVTSRFFNTGNQTIEN